MRKEVKMSAEVLQIVHLSDMHLFVDQQGNDYSPTHRASTVNFMKRLIDLSFTPSWINSLGDGLNTHLDSTLSALWQTLRRIINQKGASKLILIHSGDLSAYGHSGDTNNPFPAFDFWKYKKNSLRNDIDYFIDIYGNHDVWPGTLPLFDPQNIKQAVNSLRSRAEYRDTMPTREIVPLNSYRIEIYRLNTVCSAWPLNSLAVGKIQADYPVRDGWAIEYQLSRSKDSIKELVALAEDASQNHGDNKAVRIIVMHHPPHYFNSNPFIDLIGGRLLLNRRDFLSAFDQTRFHIIIAGHRHIVDPPINTTLTTHQQLQKPLPSNTVQLAAASTTQEVTDPDKERPSLNLYKLIIDDTADQLRIERVIYRHENDLDTAFAVGQNETIITNLRLS